MDPQMKQLMMMAIVALAIRLVLAIIATRRGWKWKPWGVLALEFILEIVLPALEGIFSMISLIVLVVMCFKKPTPKVIE